MKTKQQKPLLFQLFEHDDQTALKHDAEVYSLIFVVLGGVCFVSYFMQVIFEWVKQL